MGNLFYDEPRGTTLLDPGVDQFGRRLFTSMTFRGVTYSVGDKIVRLHHPHNDTALTPNCVYEIAMLRETGSVNLSGGRENEFWGLEYFRRARASDLRDLPHG